MKQNSFSITVICMLSCIIALIVYDRYNKRYINPGSYITIDKSGNRKYFINPKDKSISELYYEVDRFTYSEWIKGNDILIRK